MSQGRVLLISDNIEMTTAVEGVLRARDYETVVVADSESALEFIKNTFDLVLLQYSLTRRDAKEYLAQIYAVDPLVLVALLVEGNDINGVSEFPQNGVYEVLLYPLNMEKFTFLVKAAAAIATSARAHKKVVLSLEERNASLQKQNLLLARRVEEATKNLSHLYDDLRATYMRTIRSLVEAIDARDHYTCSHSQKVGRYALMIAEAMGLSLRDIENIRQACELHDVGKIGIDDRILTKPGPLNEEEWEQIKLHALKGAQILEPLTFLEEVVAIVRQHHERFDGKGYPGGLRGNEITMGARIVSLADAYDVMTSVRTYRKEVLSKEEAIEEIQRNAGSQFDPKVVEVFLTIAEKI